MIGIPHQPKTRRAGIPVPHVLLRRIPPFSLPPVCHPPKCQVDEH